MRGIFLLIFAWFGPAVAIAADCDLDRYRELLSKLNHESSPNFRFKIAPEEGAPYVLEGTARRLDLGPDYRVYFIKDKKGRIHLIDSKSGIDESKIERIEKSAGQPRRRAEVEMDFSQAKKHLCSEYLKFGNTEGFKQVQSVLESKLSLQKLRASSTWRCVLDSVSTFVPAFLVDPSQVIRLKWAREKSHPELRKFLDHTGNFYESMLLMGAIQHCSVWAGGAYGPALLRSVKVGLSANAIAEINVAGSPILNLPDAALRKTGMSDSGGGVRVVPERKTSDWADLGSGAAGVASYVVWSAFSKKLFNFSFEKACR